MADKVFFGNVKEITNDYGTMFNIGITQDDLNKLEFNDKGFANVSLKKWKSWKWYIEVFNPENTQWKNNEPSNNEPAEEDLPF